MKLIVAVDNKWGIGANNDLLFHLPTDMKFYRETTTGKTVIMGEKTLISLPGSKPLPNRETVVITLDKSFVCEGATILYSKDDVLNFCKNKDAYVCGGEMIYRLFLPHCKEALVTKIEADGKAEKFLDNLDKLPNWKLVKQSEKIKENGLTFSFCTYVNNDVK